MKRLAPAARPARVTVACGILGVAFLTGARPAHAWGTLGHTTIAGEYGGSLPWPLDGLRSEDAWVVAHVMDPDTRKGTIPSERFRHYIDIDAYAEYHAGTLSHDRAVLEAAYGAAQVEQWGVVPWAIGEAPSKRPPTSPGPSWSPRPDPTRLPQDSRCRDSPAR